MCYSLQLHYHRPYLLCKLVPFLNFRWFSIKATPVHHSLIQMEVDEPLTKDAVEPSAGDAGFYSDIFVVHKPIGSLHPILNPKQCDCYIYIYIPILRSSLSDRYGNLFNRAIMLFFLLISKMLIYIFILFSITITFKQFV